MEKLPCDKLHEECGVFGVYDRGEVGDVARLSYYGLYALQHRGQESCGIAVNDDGVINLHKDTGLVNEVFTKEKLDSLTGQMAVGHCRYATTGSKRRSNAQPLLVRHIKGHMALAHNGNLTNAAELREQYEMEGAIFHTTTDTEVIAYTITKERIRQPSIERAVLAAMEKIAGAYSLVIMSPRKLIAARDPMGFRPLCMGRIGESVVFASESCALDAVGATFERDIEPGEVVVVSEDGIQCYTEHCNKAPRSLCVFEFIYFARPDSVVDGASVHMARQKAGQFLARQHPVDADVVIGVPDSGLDAALGYSMESGIPFNLGFLKNKYIGRTFIAPNQAQRENDVRVKLNPISSVVKGKRVVLIDDSIVRGTTSKKIVKLMRKAGATEVHMRLSSPPFLYPCYFGVDIDSSENLIAYNHTVEQIAQIIGVDSLGYLSVDCLDQLADGCKEGFCKACFTGNYPVKPPKKTEKNKFECKLSERREKNGE
ncbi:MAG: amidophosphoribosyltransferase [Pygmaiobacter massiliensis]|nr:amidophosphoribosyltransferase [Pygmaiobacter massiliensis]